MSIYVRMLSLPCGRRIDWNAAQAEFETYFDDAGNTDDCTLDSDALERVRFVLEHPEETGLRAFVHAGTICYLAIGYEYDPPEALEALWNFDEAWTVLEAAGLEIVSTQMDGVDWTKPETIIVGDR